MHVYDIPESSTPITRMYPCISAKYISPMLVCLCDANYFSTPELTGKKAFCLGGQISETAKEFLMRYRLVTLKGRKMYQLPAAIVYISDNELIKLPGNKPDAG